MYNIYPILDNDKNGIDNDGSDGDDAVVGAENGGQLWCKIRIFF